MIDGNLASIGEQGVVVVSTLHHQCFFINKKFDVIMQTLPEEEDIKKVKVQGSYCFLQSASKVIVLKYEDKQLSYENEIETPYFSLYNHMIAYLQGNDIYIQDGIII